MHMRISYRIINTGLMVGLSLLAGASAAVAQQYSRTTPTEADLYCSGVITNKPIPNKLYVVSGEDSRFKTTFMQGDEIFINAGASEGVKVGDQFEVVRPITDMMATTVWFKYQAALSHAMGTRYADIGRLRVVRVDPKTSTTEVALGCNLIQRGDLLQPFVVRPAPQFRAVSLDPFAPPSGKKTAMVVSGKEYAILTGPGAVVYVNLGSEQGVRVGDYYRIFRYQGQRTETVYQLKDTAYKTYGFGSSPVAYQWNDLPRQVLGEGIVLRTGPNSSTVMLTTVREEIFAGDYVEVE
jgi:hypothetical protein